MRIDTYLLEKNFFDSRTKAKQAIERGEIFINGKRIDKPSLDVDSNCEIERVCEKEFVSVGGFKLQKAIDDFSFSVKDLIVADIGASTGGFSDCLLKNGAKKIYAVDLRNDLLHKKILEDDRVALIVKNAKDLSNDDFNDKLDLIVADLSFISIVQVVDVFYKLIKKHDKAIILIKPQFETGKRQKFKNGIIRDKKILKNICENIYKILIEHGFNPLKITTAPFDNEKNIEFLILIEKDGLTKLDSNFFDNIKF